MKKLKIYLDTSVINFIQADDAPELRDVTRKFFSGYVGTGRYSVFVSPVVIDELNRTANVKKRLMLLDILDEYELVSLDLTEGYEEIRRMAECYLTENVIPLRKIEDALYVAICTVLEMDVLLSWNYKHLANVNRELRILAVNLKEGYTHPFRMVTPLEVMYEDD